MSFKWYIYCNTEEAPVWVWQNNEPIGCPNDPSHDTTGQCAFVIAKELEMMRFSNLSVSVSTSLPTKILSTIINPVQGYIRRITFLVNEVVPSGASYTIKVINSTDGDLLGTFEVSSISQQPSIVSTEVLEVLEVLQGSPLDHSYILDIVIEKSEEVSSTIQVSEIILYRES
jgi:hypothetical protein